MVLQERRYARGIHQRECRDQPPNDIHGCSKSSVPISVTGPRGLTWPCARLKSEPLSEADLHDGARMPRDFDRVNETHVSQRPRAVARGAHGAPAPIVSLPHFIRTPETAVANRDGTANQKDQIPAFAKIRTIWGYRFQSQGDTKRPSTTQTSRCLVSKGTTELAPSRPPLPSGARDCPLVNHSTTLSMSHRSMISTDSLLTSSPPLHQDAHTVIGRENPHFPPAIVKSNSGGRLILSRLSSA